MCNTCKRYNTCSRAAAGERCRNYREAETVTRLSPEEYAAQIGGKVITMTGYEHISSIVDDRRTTEVIVREFPAVVLWRPDGSLTYSAFPRLFSDLWHTHPFCKMSKEWQGRVIERDIHETTPDIMAAIVEAM